MALVNAENADSREKAAAKKAEKIAQPPQPPVYSYKPKKYNLFQRLIKVFIEAFTTPKEGDPDYGRYGPTLKEQHAAKAAREAKLGEENRRIVDNILKQPILSPEQLWEKEKAELLVKLELLKKSIGIR